MTACGVFALGSTTLGGSIIQGLQGTATCTVGIKYSGDDVTLKATPIQGVAPYTIEFRISPPQSMIGDETGATDVIPSARLGGFSNPTYNVTEGTDITRVYTLDNTDIEGATSKIPGEGPSIIFAVEIIDSCFSPQSCIKYCKTFVGCTAPVCNFTVT